MNSNHIHHYNLHNNYNNNNINTNTNTNYPSFSSSLLEEIYRSFDDDKSRIDRRRVDRYVLEQWIDKEKEKEKEKEKNIKFRRNSMPETGNYRRPLNSSSSTSSSDSSSGIGGFSSSDTESVYGAPARMSAKIPSLKPIRTVANTAENTTEFVRKSYSGDNTAAAKAKAKKSKKDGKLQHALKLYADLKKVKQPISPGGKIASFLNSLFNSGNSKKSKVSPPSTAAVTAAMKSASVPSSASSYSRSCLSKTPSSAGRYERRSVRFCPVSVVVDEAGEKSVYNDVVSRMDVCGGEDEELKAEIREKQRRVEEAAKELLKNYRSNQIRKEFKVNVISNVNQETNNNINNNNNNVNVNVNMRGFEDEDDDDEESCCSSDLFELDNLLEIGVGDNYCQELPVYETTHVGRNRAIANGSIL